MVPGLRVFTIRSPIITEIAVVKMYIKIVLLPILLNFFKSDREATPVIKEERTRGTAISFSRLINMIPNGAIHNEVKWPNPKLEDIIP